MSLHVDFDRDLWVYVPAEWPWEQFRGVEEWSTALVNALGEAYGYDASMREWLDATLQGMSRGADADEHRFAYLARPHEVLGLASIYEQPVHADLSPEQLAGADDPRATRPVAAAPFEGGRLGRGLSAVRHLADENGIITAVAQWVWRLDDRDVLMVVGDDDLARFELLRDDYDALARSIGTAD